MAEALRCGEEQKGTFQEVEVMGNWRLHAYPRKHMVTSLDDCCLQEMELIGSITSHSYLLVKYNLCPTERSCCILALVAEAFCNLPLSFSFHPAKLYHMVLFHP